MSSNDLISRMALYEKTAEWEAQALHMVELHLHDDDKAEWRKWSTVLAERSAFKQDVADAPAVPHEMSAREYVNARRRLCNAHLNAVTQCVDDFVTRCAGCLIEDYCEGAKDDVDEEIAIVEQWAEEHPENIEKKRKTYAEDFLSHYPKAQVSKDGVPFVCRKHITDKPLHCTQYNYNCTACWNEEMEDEE